MTHHDMGLVRRVLPWKRGALLLTLVVVLLSPTVALGWNGDHFDGNASGQAVYESMAIQPEVVHRGDMTYMVYQGFLMDPYIIGFDHSTQTWDGPYKIGYNHLKDYDWNPLDSHGAPSLLVGDGGLLHVFWGAHGGAAHLRHARQTSAGDLKNWTELSTLGSLSYPQALEKQGADANHALIYRVDSGAQTGGFIRKESSDGNSWGNLEWIVAGDPSNYGWYGNFTRANDGRINAALLTYHRVQSSPFGRGDIFYLYRDPSDGSWRNVAGSIAPSSSGNPPTYADLITDPSTPTVVHQRSGGEWQNQVVVASPDDAVDRPGLLFLNGKGYGPNSYKWTFSRWDGAAWRETVIANTDHFMDSGALEFETSMTVNAYLTRKGTEGKGSSQEQYVDRGGDIEWWQSTDGGDTWTFQKTIATAELDRGMIYNDPQVVDADTPESEARLLFSEWNNDAGNMFHRAFLWGDDGYRQKEFFPDFDRIDGRDRYVVSAGLSQEAFPIAAETVFIASGEVFSDALAGVPLAANYKRRGGTLRGIPAPGPILLVKQDAIPSVVAAELKRLNPDEIVILGGPATITEGVEGTLKSYAKDVRRIGGADRNAVSVNVANELKTAMGGSVDGVVYANGSDAKAGDALSVSPLAAAKGWPVLLIGPEPNKVSSAVGAFVNQLPAGSSVTIVGGTKSVAENAYTGGIDPIRLAGYDRYATSAAIARFGLMGNGPHTPSMTMSRFAVTSGEVFSDALPGGVLEARAHGPILLTQPGKLPAPILGLLEAEAYEVDQAYVLGGVRSVEPLVGAEIVRILTERQDAQHP